MTKPGWGFLPWVLGICGLASLGTPSPADADWEQIKRSGTLRVVTDVDPSTAFDNELLAGFLALHGLKIEMLRDRPLAERIPLVLSGEADLALSLFITDERRKLVDFTVEVLPTVYTMATCRPQAVVDDVAELRTRQVGLMKGSVMEQAALRAGVPDQSVAGFPDISSVIEALCAGKVTAALVAMPDLALYRPRYPGLEYGAPMAEVMSAGWALRKDSPELKATLDAYLTNSRRGGGWNRLVVKHFGTEALKVLGRLSAR